MPDNLQKLWELTERENKKYKESLRFREERERFGAMVEPELQRQDFEIGPDKLLGKLDPNARGFVGELNARDAALIKERYPTLAKWLKFGKQSLMLKEAFGHTAGSKLHRNLTMLPDRLKNLVTNVKEHVSEEFSDPLPLGLHPGMAKLGLKWITDPKASPQQRREGWKHLTEELAGVVRHLPHKARMLRYDLNTRGPGTRTKELGLFGVEPGKYSEDHPVHDGTRGLVDQAREDYQKHEWEPSSYRSLQELRELKKKQAMRHFEYFRDRIERGQVRPDPALYDPET